MQGQLLLEQLDRNLECKSMYVCGLYSLQLSDDA